MFQILKYENINKNIFFNFLKEEVVLSKDPAAKNMWEEDWEKGTNYTLPYILEKSNRFNTPNGQFHVVLFNNEIIGCAGVYKSDFNNKISLAGSRLWIKKEFRNQGINKDLTLKIHKKWSLENNCEAVALCFNDYNKNLIEVFKRNRLGEKNNRLKYRTKENLFYNGIIEVPFPVVIQYTKQWIIYEKLKDDFNFDWSLIEWSKK